MLEGSFTYGSYTVPLPQGQWTVMSENRLLNNLNVLLGEVILADIAGDNTVPRLLLIGTVLAQGGNAAGWVADRECERKDLHYLTKRSNSTTDLACDFVSHITPSAARSGSSFDKVITELRDRGIRVPVNAIISTSKRANSMNYLLFQVIFNPEAEGIPPSPASGIVATEWNPRNIDRFPARKAYVEKVIAWNKEWTPRIDAAFGR